MDNQINLFKKNISGNLTVIEGGSTTPENNPTLLKCFKTELKEIGFKSVPELFSGFNTIKAITFSYNIGFIDSIMKNFNYGEIILGADFLVCKDNKYNEFLSEVFTNIHEAGKAVSSHKKLAEMVSEGSLFFCTPVFILDHRKIYLLKSDNGSTRVITTSANMTGRAWNGDQMEFYEYDDSPYCYEEYSKDFETAWKNSEELPMSVISSKKADDLVEGNAVLKKIKETGHTIVLQQPEDIVSFDNIKYTIDHEKIKEEYKVLLNGINTKDKHGMAEIVPKTIEKIQHNQKKLAQKKVTINNVTEKYPVLSFDFANKEAFLNGKILDLDPEDDKIKQDIEEMLSMFSNFSQFVGDTRKLQETHFKLINAMFSSPFNAKLRCTAKIRGIGTSSLPLFLLAVSETANCGKTFIISAALKMITGKNLPVINKADCKKEDVRIIQAGCKGIPVFIDEMDNKYLANIKDIIKNPERCEENQIEEQPMLLFASNNVTDPDETIRKRMVLLRFNSSLPSSIDQNAYKGMGNAVIKRLGTAFYREYLKRMLDIVSNELDYIIHDKNIPDSYYPDLMAPSSDTIMAIISGYGYSVPGYMHHLSWNHDYSVNAGFIAEDAINEIKQLYQQNKKSFILCKETVTIELGPDRDSENKCKVRKNILPPEMKVQIIHSRDCKKIVMDRTELEARLGFKLTKNSIFSRR
ncbi:MAG: lantibiotic ABC transporter [Lachnospiraceae bacterium]|nr:lantibiotic ABC transporter [Lachnospiraceae bacterium]